MTEAIDAIEITSLEDRIKYQRDLLINPEVESNAWEQLTTAFMKWFPQEGPTDFTFGAGGASEHWFMPLGRQNVFKILSEEQQKLFYLALVRLEDLKEETRVLPSLILYSLVQETATPLTLGELMVLGMSRKIVFVENKTPYYLWRRHFLDLCEKDALFPSITHMDVELSADERAALVNSSNFPNLRFVFYTYKITTSRYDDGPLSAIETGSW